MEISQEFEGILTGGQEFYRQKKSKNVTPLKDGQSAFGVSHPDVADASKIRPKRKKKSPSAVARDRARSQKFWKQKKSANICQLTAQQPRTKDTVLEEETSIRVQNRTIQLFVKYQIL